MTGNSTNAEEEKIKLELEPEKIELEKIKTEAAAKNFVEIFLQKNKAYLLDGEWDRDKTKFLKEELKQTNKKFVFLDFWQIKDDRTAIAIVFNKLHPRWYRFITIVKLDYLYSKFIVRGLKNKILIIEDFDRVKAEKQKEIYKLFNILNGKLPIICVNGKYIKLELEPETIELEKIKTEVAAKNFVEIFLQKNKAYLLDGEWDSDKTKSLKEELKQKNKKFVFLDFWQIKDNKKATAIVFNKLHLRWYRFITIVKLDYLYSKFIVRGLKNKILIIEDFDRVEAEKQKEIYKLFNILNGKLPIICVNGKYIKLEYIDTKAAAKNFVDLLQENKTYLLHGEWGSGKTKFLEEAQKQTNKKFVFIDFWQIKDDRTAIAIGFNKLHPCWYYLVKILAILSVAVFISMSQLIRLENMVKWIPWFILDILLILGLLVAVCKFFKVKLDYLYSNVISWGLKNKVLIIDDFDRVEAEKQKEIYKLFNILNGKLPIIFAGNYSNLANQEDNFLQKIIDKRIELPYDLHPNNIWVKYYKQLGYYLDCIKEDSKGMYHLIRVTVLEQRNLRDRKQFNDLVNQEFITFNKKDRVQIVQQLWVIYAYLFYPEYYKILVDGGDFEKTNTNAVNSLELVLAQKKGKAELKDAIAGVLDGLRNKGDGMYPTSFKQNKENYFICVALKNMTREQCEAIFANDTDLQDYLEESAYESAFYQYILATYRYFEDGRKTKLLNIVFDLYHENIGTYNQPSDLLLYIVDEKNKEIILEIGEKEVKKRYEKWNDILTDQGKRLSRVFDDSEKFYFLVRFSVFSFEELYVAEKIFDDDTELQKYVAKSNYNTDFYQYISAEYKKFSTEVKEKLLNIVFDLYHENIDTYNQPSDLMFYIVGEKKKEIISQEGEKEVKKRYEKWNDILTDQGKRLSRVFDDSEKFYFLVRFSVFSFEELYVANPDLKLASEQKKLDYYLLACLFNEGDLYFNYEQWDTEVWNIVNKMSIEQIITFFCGLQMIILKVNSSYSSGRPEDIIAKKSFTIFQVIIPLNIPSEKQELTRAKGFTPEKKEAFEKNIQPILEKLKQKRYTYKIELIKRQFA